MTTQRKILLFLSILISLLSTYLLWEKVGRWETRGKEERKRERIVVAGKDIQRGDTFSPENLEAMEILAKDYFPRMLREGDFPSIEGALSKNSIRQGNPVNWDDIENPVELNRFSLSIQEGKRALSLPADEQVTLSGMLRPGDHVDIYLTSGNEFEQESTTMLLLENVIVSAIDSRFTDVSFGEGDDISPGTVTLLVTGMQAACLLNAVSNPSKKLGLVLRNPKEPPKTVRRGVRGKLFQRIELFKMGRLEKTIRVGRE